MAKVKDYLIHYKKKLEYGLVDDQKVLEIFQKLEKVRITKDLLEETVIAKTVKHIAKTRGGEVGEKGFDLVKHWKKIVESEISNKSSKSSSSVKNSCNDKIKIKVEQSFNKSKNVHSDDTLLHKKNTLNHIKSEMLHDIEKTSCKNGFSQLKSEKYSNMKNISSSETYDPANPYLHVQEYKPSPISETIVISNKRSHTSDSHSSHNKKMKQDNVKTENLSNTKHNHNIKHNSSNHNLMSKSNSITSQNNESKHTNSSNKEMRPQKSSDSTKKLTHQTSTKSPDKISKKKSDTKPLKKKIKIAETEEFTSSQATFEDCLGFNDIVSPQKKKPSNKITKVKPLNSDSSKSTKEKVSKLKTKDIKTSDSSKSSAKRKEVLKSNHKKEKSLDESVKLPKELKVKPRPIKIEENEIKLLPEINPHYQPLPRFDFESSLHKKKVLSNEEAIMFTSSKKDRTAVYSGRRNYFLTEVPSLFEICTRILVENITQLEQTGGVPYSVLKPVFERCSAMDLFRLEYFNPYLLEDTQELWEKHCAKDFKNHKRQESETWRDMYMRISEERKEKLAKLTSNIKESMSASNPTRRAKLAYVDSYVKPPRDVARKQAKFGTGLPVSHSVKSPPSPPKSSPKSSTSSLPVASEKVSVVEKPVAIPKKPSKPAPLMAKTLKAMKQVYRR